MTRTGRSRLAEGVHTSEYVPSFPHGSKMTEIKRKISRILEAEAAAIAAIKVTDAFEDAVTTLKQSSGKIVCTGIGKAGFVAQKICCRLMFNRHASRVYSSG